MADQNFSYSLFSEAVSTNKGSNTRDGCMLRKTAAAPLPAGRQNPYTDMLLAILILSNKTLSKTARI